MLTDFDEHENSSGKEKRMKKAELSHSGNRKFTILLIFIIPFLFFQVPLAASGIEMAKFPSFGKAIKPKDPGSRKGNDNYSITGSVGAGLSMTSGNSNTLNWNVSFDLDRETRSGHSLQASGLYLRGKENDKLSVNRLKFNFRDDYYLNKDVVGFGDVSYKRDPLKGIDHLINPSAGLGWKILDGERVSLQTNAGAGVVMEQNNGLGKNTSVSLNSSQSLSWKLTDTASFRQKTDVLWKADNVDDYLINFSMALATKVTNASELQAEFLDDYKSNPTNISYKKNDIALILKYVVRF